MRLLLITITVTLTISMSGCFFMERVLGLPSAESWNRLKEDLDKPMPPEAMRILRPEIIYGRGTEKSRYKDGEVVGD